MGKYWTGRMEILGFSYQEFWRDTCTLIGITDPKVIERYEPSYRERDKDGKLVGNSRLTRYVMWADKQTVLETSHYDRLRTIERYIRITYKKIADAVQKEREIKAFFKKPVVLATVKEKKQKVESNAEQLTFDF